MADEKLVDEKLVQEMQQSFKDFDTDGDGKITAQELRNALEKKLEQKPSARDIDHLMEEIDTNKDGFITFEEFTVFYKKNLGLMKDIAKAK